MTKYDKINPFSHAAQSPESRHDTTYDLQCTVHSQMNHSSHAHATHTYLLSSPPFIAIPVHILNKLITLITNYLKRKLYRTKIKKRLSYEKINRKQLFFMKITITRVRSKANTQQVVTYDLYLTQTFLKRSYT